VPCAIANPLAREHTAAHDVERDDLPARGVGDVRVTAVGMCRGVSRLLEAAENAHDRETPHERDGADLRMRDDRRAADRLDAPRRRKRRHVPDDASRRQVHGHEARFLVRSDKRNGPTRTGEGARREH
jgi:hypothetical protein